MRFWSFILIIAFSLAASAVRADDPEQLKLQAKLFLLKLESSYYPWRRLGADPRRAFNPQFAGIKSKWNTDIVRPYRDRELTNLYTLINEKLETIHDEIRIFNFDDEERLREGLFRNYQSSRDQGLDHGAAWVKALSKFRSINYPKDSQTSVSNFEEVRKLVDITYEQYLEGEEKRRKKLPSEQARFELHMERLAVEPHLVFFEEVGRRLKSGYLQFLTEKIWEMDQDLGYESDFSRDDFPQLHAFAADKAIRNLLDASDDLYPPAVEQIYQAARTEAIDTFLNSELSKDMKESGLPRLIYWAGLEGIPNTFKAELVRQSYQPGAFNSQTLAEHIRFLAALRVEDHTHFLGDLYDRIEEEARRSKRPAKEICDRAFEEVSLVRESWVALRKIVRAGLQERARARDKSSKAWRCARWMMLAPVKIPLGVVRIIWGPPGGRGRSF